MQQKPLYKRYYITTDDGTEEVFPQKDLVISYKLNDNGFYEQEMTGNVVLTNHYDDIKQFHGDYDYIKQYESEVYLAFESKKLCSGTYTTEWSGWLGMLGDWDEINKEFSSKTKTDSGYNLLIDNIEKEFNILNLGNTKITTTSGDYAYENNFYFKNVMEAIIDNLLPGYSYESTFFDSSDNPITGLTNDFIKLTIAQKSDIKNPEASSSATVGMLTLKEIIDFVKMINVFPYVDDINMKFRFEHLKYFENNLDYSDAKTVGLDLTTKDSGIYILNQNSYKYDLSNIYNKEIFNYSEFGRLPFANGMIEFDINQGKDKIKKYNSGRFTTDVEYIQDRTDDVDNDGFVITANNNDLSIITEDLDNEVREDDYSIAETYNCSALKEVETNTLKISSITGTTSDKAYVCLQFNNLLNTDLNDGDIYVLRFSTNSGPYTNDPFYVFVGPSPGTELGYFYFAHVLTKRDRETTEMFIYNINENQLYENDVFIVILQKTDEQHAIDFSSMSLTKTKTAAVINSPFAWGNILNNYWKRGGTLPNGQINGKNVEFDSVKFLKEETIKGVPICCDEFDNYKLIKTNVGSGILKERNEDKNGVCDLKILHQ